MLRRTQCGRRMDYIINMFVQKVGKNDLEFSVHGLHGVLVQSTSCFILCMFYIPSEGALYTPVKTPNFNIKFTCFDKSGMMHSTC